MIYSRKESQIASTPRHEMQVTVKLGAMNDGTIRAMDVYTLSNSGAFGEHGPTTVGLSGHKSIPLYTNNLEAFKFSYDVFIPIVKQLVPIVAMALRKDFLR